MYVVFANIFSFALLPPPRLIEQRVYDDIVDVCVSKYEVEKRRNKLQLHAVPSYFACHNALRVPSCF